MPRLDAALTLTAMGAKKALVHHITNWVTIYDCAQITRAWGCLPVMAHAEDEVAEMTSLAGALVLNIGTLTPELVEAMLVAAKAANRKGTPVVLDAVGAGATQLRTHEAERLLKEARVDILKGNAGEIATLAGLDAEVRGVESISVVGSAAGAADSLARRLGNVVVVTGETDLVADGTRVLAVKGGHPLMGRVVGTGCVSSSTVGCFASTAAPPAGGAASGDYASLAAQALGCFGEAGRRAAEGSAGPGDFMSALHNEVAKMSAEPGGIAVEAEEVALGGAGS